MTIIKPIVFLSMSFLILAGCSTKSNDTGKDTTSGETENIQLDTVGLQGKWMLKSYVIDSETTEFDTDADYILSFNEPDNTFGMTTDCNTIGGNFNITNDTIRFQQIMVTEMACDKMTVEENMIRLFNDTTAYAISTGDSIHYTAPNIGNAVFSKLENKTE